MVQCFLPFRDHTFLTDEDDVQLMEDLEADDEEHVEGHVYYSQEFEPYVQVKVGIDSAAELGT